MKRGNGQKRKCTDANRSEDGGSKSDTTNIAESSKSTRCSISHATGNKNSKNSEGLVPIPQAGYDAGVGIGIQDIFGCNVEEEELRQAQEVHSKVMSIVEGYHSNPIALQNGDATRSVL